MINSMEETYLRGKRIDLRPITMDDTESIINWRNQDNVKRYFIDRRLFTKESHEKWMHEMIECQEAYQFIIIEKESQKSVGSVYLREVDLLHKKAEFGKIGRAHV